MFDTRKRARWVVSWQDEAYVFATRAEAQTFVDGAGHSFDANEFTIVQLVDPNTGDRLGQTNATGGYI